MSESEHGHGNYVRKVLDDNRRYAQELLDKNNELRALVAKLQVQDEHLQRQLASSDATKSQVAELRAALAAAEQESRNLRDQLAEAQAALTANARERERLRLELERVDQDSRRYGDEFTDLQQQTNNLANLYVVTYRLHGTLDRAEVVASLREIVANLIGSEEMALFEVDPARNRLELVDAVGVDVTPFRGASLDRGLIGRAVRGGVPLVVNGSHPRGPGEEHLTAVVPLRLVETVVGAIAIFRLLPQKGGFEDLDRELFDLLASHAGMALHCTELHARHLQRAEAR